MHLRGLLTLDEWNVHHGCHENKYRVMHVGYYWKGVGVVQLESNLLVIISVLENVSFGLSG